MANCPPTRNDHEYLKFTADSRVRVTVDSVSAPTITNLVVATSGTEESHTFSTSVKRFRIRSRGKAKLQIAYTTGETNTTFITLTPGAVYEEEALALSAALTLYLESNKSGDTVEILEWA